MRRAYAALRGMYEIAERIATAKGRITVNGFKADAIKIASTDPNKQRSANARHLGSGTAAATQSVAGHLRDLTHWRLLRGGQCETRD